MVVPRFIMEHQLKAYPLAETITHRKRPLTPDRRQVFKERVFNWLKEGIIRRVQYLRWVTNVVPIKQRSGAWQERVNKLKRVNVKIDPSKYAFRMEEGKFLGYIVTNEGIRADPNKVQEIISLDAAEGPNWTREAEEAFQRVKRKLSKLQTLTVPKEGEVLMICLQPGSETISSVLIAEREGVYVTP
ncbi:hypothetical protein Tco_0783474 [Tanacetum coccineum]